MISPRLRDEHGGMPISAYLELKKSNVEELEELDESAIEKLLITCRPVRVIRGKPRFPKGPA